MSLKPRSILQLTIIGFLAVAGILIVTLILSARQFGDLSNQSQRIINQSATAMRAGRILVEQVSAMERNARQYRIVGDPDILEVYGNRRQSFADAAGEIINLGLGSEINGMLGEMVRIEARAYSTLNADSDTNRIDDHYPVLMETANYISQLINDWTNEQLSTIRDDTLDTQRLLTLQSALLVSIALILAGVFTVLITYPLVKIEKAINQLGSGIYTSQISIPGPKDLSSLGERLDWLRNRLARLEKQRSSFLRHVSHELKTPLAAMQESASLLGDGVVGKLTAEQEEIIRIQNKNCQRLQALIDNLLRHNRENFSILNSMPEEVRLYQLIEQVVDAHELTLKSCRIEVRKNLSRDKVLGNPEQLRVVIDNLFTNAIKFSPEGGVIDIRQKSDSDFAVIDIIDQGPGIDPQDSDKIFEAFFQGKESGNDAFPGNGLGLAIVQEYVQENGGEVGVVQSGGGGHFRLRLPLKRSKSV